jgi:hypothetical protein
MAAGKNSGQITETNEFKVHEQGRHSRREPAIF